MSESWKTKEVLEKCLQYVSTPKEIIIEDSPLNLWPHTRGYDCGPCDLGKQGRCGRLPCMGSEGLPYGLPLINWQTSTFTTRQDFVTLIVLEHGCRPIAHRLKDLGINENRGVQTP